jgi:hypothetical protein
MELDFLTILFWWIILSLLSIALILLRDDADLFYKDITSSLKDGYFYLLSFVIAYIFYAPMTLPYSINYFLEKWKKN